MKRRVVLHGPSSLSISLPSEWAKKYSVQKGDEVSVDEKGAHLIVSSGNDTDEITSTTVSFKDLSPETFKEIISALHRRGYDEIKIQHDSESVLKEINKLLNEMHFGFEIIKHDVTSTTIRNVSIPEKTQFNNLFRRLFLVLLEYGEKIGELLSDSGEQTQTYLLHETSIKRISNFCERILANDIADRNSPFLYSIVEGIVALAKEMSTLLGNLKEENVPEDLITSYNKILGYLHDAYSLHYTFSFEKYDILRKNISADCLRLDKFVEDGIYWSDLKRIYLRVGDILTPILSVKL